MVHSLPGVDQVTEEMLQHWRATKPVEWWQSKADDARCIALNVERDRSNYISDAREAKDPESRARALSNSVLAKAYATAGQGGNRRGRSKQEEAEEAMFEQQKQVSEAFEKMERQKHLAQTMERVNNAYTVWDNRPGARDDSTRAVADVKRAISRWLVDGETREQHAAKIADLLRELDGWLQHENAMPPPAAADAASG